jgi:DNA-binding NtrC family response regulator
MTSQATDPHRLVGESQQAASIRKQIEKAARNRLPVLLLGESGTGKEVVARSIYDANPEGRFVPIDCGSLVGTLMESDLFGHVRGAFSGATENKKGLVELADGGTAFFDEIGDLPLEMQVKLLRLIQESEFRPVGGLQWRKVNIRIIAATHRDLKAEVAAGRFRLDLYYRLNVFAMRLPPLRQRKEDIPLLVEHFLEKSRDQGMPAMHVSDELMEVFQSYDWPGNVRELKHCIDRLSAMQSEGALLAVDLPSAMQTFQTARALADLSGALEETPMDLPAMPAFHVSPAQPVISLPESERYTIARALTATGGERGKTARLLGIGRTTLYRKMKQYGIA